MSEPHPAKVTKARSSGPSFANVRFHIGPDGISAPEVSADENVGAELATWAEQLLRSIDSQTVRDRGLRGTLSIDVTLEGGRLGLTPAAERWLEWTVLDLLGASQGLKKPRQPKAAIAVRWIPAGDVSQNLTTPSEQWQKGPVRGRAKDEADGAFRKTSGGPERTRVTEELRQKIQRETVEEMAKRLVPVMPQADVDLLLARLLVAQSDSPSNTRSFVGSINAMLDQYGLRVLSKGTFCRLGLNRQNLCLTKPEGGIQSFDDPFIKVVAAPPRKFGNRYTVRQPE
jgi:hypothetical protein